MISSTRPFRVVEKLSKQRNQIPLTFFIQRLITGADCARFRAQALRDRQQKLLDRLKLTSGAEPGNFS
jgi:hypothetical protein